MKPQPTVSPFPVCIIGFRQSIKAKPESKGYRVRSGFCFSATRNDGCVVLRMYVTVYKKSDRRMDVCTGVKPSPVRSRGSREGDF